MSELTSAATLSEYVFHYVMAEANLIVGLLDENGTIQKTNAHTEAFFGRRLENENFAELLVDFKQQFSLARILKNDQWPILLSIRGKDELPQTYLFHFFDMGDQVLAVGQLNADELETMRRTFIGMNNELGNLNRQLQKQKIKLEKLNALKNQFFGMAAHDLRHPLGVIRMYGEFLADEVAQQLEAEHQEFIRHIQKSALLLEQILNDFLDVAVFESGRLPIDKAPIDVGLWMAPIVAANRVLASRKSVAIDYHTNTSQRPDQARRELDASKMEQVVNNLISNAVKFSKPGDTVQVTLDLELSGMRIAVRDSGPGIAPEDVPRLFLPFERIQSTKTPQEKSSGLGLAIVKKIVEAHGGQVSVSSTVGKGSVFTVQLPSAVLSPGG